jgi:transcriptional regulator with XRE-family HTH domain
VPVDREITASVGRAVRTLRIDQGLTQEELADRCDMHRTYVGGIERGERNPTVTVIYRLADALSVKGSDLLAAAEQSAQD